MFSHHLCQAPCIRVEPDIRFVVREYNMCSRELKQKHRMLDRMSRYLQNHFSTDLHGVLTCFRGSAVCLLVTVWPQLT